MTVQKWALLEGILYAVSSQIKINKYLSTERRPCCFYLLVIYLTTSSNKQFEKEPGRKSLDFEHLNRIGLKAYYRCKYRDKVAGEIG